MAARGITSRSFSIGSNGLSSLSRGCRFFERVVLFQGPRAKIVADPIGTEVGAGNRSRTFALSGSRSPNPELGQLRRCGSRSWSPQKTMHKISGFRCVYRIDKDVD